MTYSPSLKLSLELHWQHRCCCRVCIQAACKADSVTVTFVTVLMMLLLMLQLVLLLCLHIQWLERAHNYLNATFIEET